MSLHLSPTCFPLDSHSGCLGPHECTLVSHLSPTLGSLGCMSLHLSPTLVSHSGSLGPHDFTLVSHLSLTLGCLEPHDFTLVCRTCLPLWVPWVASFYTCFPLVPHTLGSLGRMSLHLSSTCLPHLSFTLCVLGRFYTCLPHLSPTLACLLHLSPTLGVLGRVILHTCLSLSVSWAA